MGRTIFFASIFKGRSVLVGAICLLATITAWAADFDGDGKPDEFSVTRQVEKVAGQAGIRLVNPWHVRSASKQSAKGIGLVIRLTRVPQTFVLHDPDFFDTPSWKEGQTLTKVITKKDKSYAAWKKQVPTLKGDAIELGTEAGIDILLYWDGKWKVFWPKEEP